MFDGSARGLGRLLLTSKVPALKQCVIVKLFLGGNAIGDHGATSLANGLTHASGLQELHLNDNEASSSNTTLTSPSPCRLKIKTVVMINCSVMFVCISQMTTINESCLNG